MKTGKIYIVYGAPFSGKTTYVKGVIGVNDMVFDFDKLMYALTFKESPTQSVIKYVLSFRSMLINMLKKDVAIGNVYITTTFIGKSFEQSLQGFDVEFKKMDTTKESCIERLGKSNRNDKETIKELIQDWYEKYGSHGEHIPMRERKKIYNRKKWKVIRDKVLERDNYECVWCKEKGKVTVREHTILEVDHIKEIERAPELIYDMDNLRTLCSSCHSKRHKRYKRNHVSNLEIKKKKWANDERW